MPRVKVNVWNIRYGYRCSFCGKHQDEVAKLVAGPGVYICDECIRKYDDLARGEEPSVIITIGDETHEGNVRNSKQGNKGATCSFCGRRQKDVRHLIAGLNDVFICDGCPEPL